LFLPSAASGTEPLGDEPEIYAGAFAEIEEEVEVDELAATLQAAAAIVPAPAAAEPAESTKKRRIELDPTRSSARTWRADEEPTSLVKPPPTWPPARACVIGSAWSADGKEAAAAPVQEEPEAVEEVELPRVEFELEIGAEVVPRNLLSAAEGAVQAAA